ncbi:hypothetical protein BR93DRAFT_932572 [Coniochaeta sp. PMI_546]|nr:hypothetical protein BR93DRAFT_932572 [Coniochaeta sp. PMI_546]
MNPMLQKCRSREKQKFTATLIAILVVFSLSITLTCGPRECRIVANAYKRYNKCK